MPNVRSGAARLLEPLPPKTDLAELDRLRRFLIFNLRSSVDR
jgi:hypothetical protein